MKPLFYLLLQLFSLKAFTQIAISTNASTPHASAMLEVKSSDKGMLVPRMTTAQRTAIATPAAGLIVYDNTTSSFWFHNATAWTEIANEGNGWSLTGNTGTSPATHFIGTTDAQPLRIRVNNSWSGEIHPTNGNVFLGLASGQSNTIGEGNTAIGDHSMFANTEGGFNTAIGNYSMPSNTTGYNNTALGVYALSNNTTGSSNTAQGRNALFANSIGFQNSAMGVGALLANTEGSSNTATGYQALTSSLTGVANTASGFKALYSNTSGSNNTAVGDNALYNNVAGTNNIAIGSNSGPYSGAPNFHNSIGIGNSGNFQTGGSNQVIIGNFSTTSIGGKVNWGIVSDARIKNTITEDVKGLDFITRLRPVTYYISSEAITKITRRNEAPDFPGKYDAEKVKYTGFLAQEVEQAAKDAGYDFSGFAAPKNEQSLYTIKYAEFVVPLVKAVQEQQVIIEKQQQKTNVQAQQIGSLQQENDEMRARLEKLEKLALKQ